MHCTGGTPDSNPSHRLSIQLPVSFFFLARKGPITQARIRVFARLILEPFILAVRPLAIAILAGNKQTNKQTILFDPGSQPYLATSVFSAANSTPQFNDTVATSTTLLRCCRLAIAGIVIPWLHPQFTNTVGHVSVSGKTTISDSVIASRNACLLNGKSTGIQRKRRNSAFQAGSRPGPFDSQAVFRFAIATGMPFPRVRPLRPFEH